ncbi:ABC transporter substrate-binding protein [Arthrobacter sp. MYb214]|uniref:ABC transporter substrate-binding protein n=1 Tax=Arthrobacter sp. MYb214 TaxID=1848596 RepID=UPI000CFCF4B5|nr:ABC transporter substrate-binding protein [Arthrobacter sp. MYb214]PRB76854.1 ABC transporter substrate-binding protein [Arthrobacter sp. MYb214]
MQPMTRRVFFGAASLAAALALAACSPSTQAASPSSGEASAAWSFTDSGYGKTISMDATPQTLVTDSYSAAALWDYGIRPSGVFGYGLDESGSLALGSADPAEMTIIGQDGEFSLEKLLGLDPDLIVGFGNAEGTGWTWWDDKVQAEATATAPFLGIKFGNRPVLEVIEDYESLAKSLGGDIASQSAAKADYQAKLEQLRALAKDQPLRIIALNGYDDLYVGQKSLGQLALLDELGFDIVGQTEDSGWASMSWEKVADYPADVVLSYSGTAQQVKDHPVFASLPAVEASQVVEWDDKRPFTYSSYAQWFDELIAVLNTAKSLN